MSSMPLPTPNPVEAAAAVLASSHRHWEPFGAQHEGQHFLSLEASSEEGSEQPSPVDEALEQLTRLAYHRARQAVLRFVDDLRTVSSYEYHSHRSMLEAAQLMRDAPAKTPYMEAIRKSLEANPAQKRMLDLAAVARNAKLASAPNPAENAILEAFVAGRAQAKGVLIARNDQCNGADLILGKTTVDKLIFNFPHEDGPVLRESGKSAIFGLEQALTERDGDESDIMETLEELCEIARDASGNWTGHFLNSMEHATPADLNRFGNLTETARLVRDDPASLGFFRPLLEMLQDVRGKQLTSAAALRMMGYDAATKSFSPRPPILTAVIDAFKADRDYNINCERDENPTSPGVAFMSQPSQGEAEIVVRRPKKGFLGPSIGLKGSDRPNPTKLEELGPFYQFVVDDLINKIAPSLVTMGLHPVVKTEDAESGILVGFETADGKGHGAVDLYFKGPSESPLSHATWLNAHYESVYNERRNVGTDGWFAIHTPDYPYESGHFDSAKEAIECTIRWTVENDLLWDDDRLLEKQVRSKAMADAWNRVEAHMIGNDEFHATVVRDDDGTEHLKFNDLAGVAHVISLNPDDMWTMSSGDSTVLETDDLSAVEALIEATVADEAPRKRHR
jgi:hypothetical protein